MKIKIEITEGCISYSYQINGFEWNLLCSKECPEEQKDLIEKTFKYLLHDINEQYTIPNFMLSSLYDNDGDDWERIPCEQSTFVYMVQAHKDTKTTYLGRCDECGDLIYRYILELDTDEIDSKINSEINSGVSL